MRRLLMTADAVGGVWTYALELASALAGMGIRTTLAVMGPAPTPDQCEEARGVPGLDLFARPYKLEWMDDPWGDVAEAAEWLLELERRARPDVVHVNGYAHAALPWRAPVLAVAHSCVLSWWEAVKGGPAPAHWDRYRGEAERGIAAASLVAAPSRAMMDAVARYYGAPRAGVVVANGRDPARFRAAPKEPLVFSAGRMWDEAKNLAALDAASRSLPWPVFVAGEAGAARVEGVRLLGRLSASAMAEWLSRAAIYALPARYEPFGLSALEAALSGCALVLGDIPSLREVWGDAACFVPPSDADALSYALRGLIGDPARRARMAARAHNRARQFTPRRMAQEYIAAYVECRQV